jgi:hypothetical protein
VTGWAACSQFRGTFEARETGHLEIEMEWVRPVPTLAPCTAEQEAFGAHLVASLEGVQSFMRDNDELLLRGTGGEIRLARER